MIRLTIAALATSLMFAAGGCRSSDPQADNAQETAVKKKKRKKKKRKKKKPVPTTSEEDVRTVQFSFKRVGLREVILPKFEEQAGVKIQWSGDERTLSLRLSNPTPWRDALALVCQFTNTHLTTDYRGRLILKNGWGGSLGGEEEAEELAGKKTNSGKRLTPPPSSGKSSTAYTPEKSPSVGYNKGNSPAEVLRKSTGGVTHH